MAGTSIITALAKALPELEGAKKDKVNPHFKNKYATLGSVIDAIEPVRKYGLWYRQVGHERPNGVCVETIYIHESGQELSAGDLFLPADKQNPQGFGSAMTYCRRYSLQSAFGLDAEDDDGNAAGKPRQEPKKEEPKELPTGPINDKTRDWLAGQIDATGHAVGEFCKAFNVGSLKEITYEQIDTAREWCRDNRKEA